MGRRWEALAVTLVAAWVGGWQAWWVIKDIGPRLAGDDVPISRATVAMFASITDRIPYKPWEFAQAPYPPLGIWLGAVGAMVLPGDPVQAMLLPQALLAAAIVPILWFGLRRLLGAPLALATAAIAPSYAVFWSIRGQFYLEFHQGVALLLVLAAWSQSDRLRKPVPAAMMGIGLGLGLLAKFSFVFFAALPALLAVAASLAATVRPTPLRLGIGALALAFGAAIVAASAGRLSVAWLAWIGVPLVVSLGGGIWRYPAEHGRWRLLGVALVVIGVAAVAGPWYLQNLGALRQFMAKNLSTTEYDGEVYPLETVWWVLPGFVLRGLLDDAAAIAFLVGAIRVLLNKEATAGRFALLAVVSGVVFLTLQPYRTPRYTFPLAGPAVVVAAHALLLPGRWRVVLGWLGVAWGLWLQASIVFPASRASMWWRRTCEIPPNSHGGVRQQWAQLTDPNLRLRWLLPGPLPGRRAVTPEVLAVVAASVDLTTLRAMTATTLPPDTCARIALDLAARGANPYLRCGNKFGATLNVTPIGPVPAGWRVVAGTVTAQVQVLEKKVP